MRVRSKLILVVTFVALAPLSVSAWTTLDVHRTTFEEKVAELQSVAAHYGAAIAQSQLEAAQLGLAGVVQRSTHWAGLSPEGREGGTWLVYSQQNEVGAVALYDAGDELQGPPAYISPDVEDIEWAAHPKLNPGALRELLTRFPIAVARRNGVAMGSPVLVGDEIMLPLAFSVDGENSNAPWAVGVALSVANICAQIVDNRPPGTLATTYDAQGNVLCSSGEVSSIPFEHIRARERDTFRYTPAGGEELLAAVAQTQVGWSVVIEEPAAEALEGARRILLQSLLWLSLGILTALLTGFILSRGITKPLRALETGARQLTAGEYSTRIDVESEDEFGDLAVAFNTMTEEIERWNQELTSRVDERTRELKSAQDQLIEVRKLAAMSTLSAGVAHEVNNPLAAVVAFTQILLSTARKANETKNVKLLERLEGEALRIKSIIERMQMLSGENQSEYSRIAVETVLLSVLQRLKPRIDEANVTATSEVEEGLPRVRANASELATAIEYLCDNAVKAMDGDERRLELSARQLDGDVIILEVRDSGRGMPQELVERVFEPFYTTKSGDWRGVGLGLSVAHRIITDHGGSIHIKSASGQGTLVTINLPTAPAAESHLA